MPHHCILAYPVLKTTKPPRTCPPTHARPSPHTLHAMPAPTSHPPTRFAFHSPCNAVLDIVGTGGDGIGSVNISTGAAVVAAAAGARVAKHGNRSVSSLCGSADVLEALGIVVDLGPEGVAACIERAGVGFMFAPTFLPAMKVAVRGAGCGCCCCCQP